MREDRTAYIMSIDNPSEEAWEFKTKGLIMVMSTLEATAELWVSK